MKILDLEIYPTEYLIKYINKVHICYSICNINSKIQMLNHPTACKEILLHDIKENYMLSEKNFQYLKLLVILPTNSEFKLNQIIKTINMFSSVNNWGKLSIYKIDRLINNLYIFDLPIQWFKFPQLISLITFIIHSCYILNINNYTTIEEYINIVMKIKLSKHTIQSILNFPRNWMVNIPLIINNYDYLFKNEYSSYFYNCEKCADKNSYKYLKYSGIKSLCLYKSLNKILNKKLKQLNLKQLNREGLK